MADDRNYDVIVLGCGVAGLSAAIAARNAGASVVVLETAPEAERGGNTTFSGGGQKHTRSGLETLAELHPDMSEEERQAYVVEPYSADDYIADIMRVTRGHADPELAQVIATQSLPTARWIRAQGVTYRRPPGIVRDGKKRVPRSEGIAGAAGTGKGLVDSLCESGQKKGVQFCYETKGLKLLVDRRGKIEGVTAKGPGGYVDLRGGAVVIATGGFESNREWRTRYLGPAWSFLRPRGTRFNQGLGLAMALEIGAQPAGHWSGCHSSAMDWDAITRTPEGQNLPIKGAPWHRAGMYNSRLSYLAGIQINVRGERFVDEGEEWMPFTYVKVGARVAEQPDSAAWQIFDARATALLTGESMLDNFGYDDAPRATAASVEELARVLCIPGLVQTVEMFNASIPASQNDWPPDFSILDGQSTVGIDPPKSNWARRLDTPPFSAFKVTTGITFSFGGLKINTSAQVLDTEGRVIPGLYAAGNSVGLWYYNYPGGGAVTAGATFGRIAGTHAAGS